MKTYILKPTMTCTTVTTTPTPIKTRDRATDAIVAAIRARFVSHLTQLDADKRSAFSSKPLRLKQQSLLTFCQTKNHFLTPTL